MIKIFFFFTLAPIPRKKRKQQNSSIKSRLRSASKQFIRESHKKSDSISPNLLTKTPTESLEKKTPSTILPIRRVAQSFPPFFKILLPPKYFSEKISRFKHTNEGDFSNVRKRPSTLSTDQIRTNISIKSSPKLSKTTNFTENKCYSHLKQREISAENLERQIFSPNQDRSIESSEENNKQFYTDKLTKNQNNSSSNISGNKLGIPFNLSPIV